MGDKLNAQSKKRSTRRKEETLRGDADTERVADVGVDRAESRVESIGTGGTIRKGADNLRLKPATHGKTLSYLKTSLARQIAKHREEATRHTAEANELEQEMAQVEQILSEWQEAIKTLQPTEEPET